ncbi:MAG: hypothetical protein MJ161_01280 [Clostridia bacterium]|nr:hypothetical protein [Clostridia bacterium]
MKQAKTEAEVKRIIDYIRPNFGECVYLYIDVMVYGIESPKLDLWYDEDEEGLNFVVMRYMDSLQIYSHKDNWDKAGLMEIVKEYDIQAVNAKMSMLDALEDELGDSYEKRGGWMFKGRSTADMEVSAADKVELAKPEDAPEIAALMCSSEQWSKMYNEEKLASQLADRMRTGMGRSWIIRDGDRIVAHDATFAEAEGVAMGSGLIVLPEYVDRLYSVALGVAIDRTLRDEGKVKFFHISDPSRMKTFKKVRNEIVAETGKWMKKK